MAYHPFEYWCAEVLLSRSYDTRIHALSGSRISQKLIGVGFHLKSGHLSERQLGMNCEHFIADPFFWLQIVVGEKPDIDSFEGRNYETFC